MKFNKTVVSLALTSAMAASLLAGCGAAKEEAAATSAASAASTSAASTSAASTSETAEATSTSAEAADGEVTKPDGYPEKNVQVIVPFSAGGNTDMSTRALLNVVSEDQGITFVVDNKTGNSGLIGMEALANSEADGYTLGAVAVDLELHICFGRTEVSMDQYTPIAATMADPYGILIATDNPNYTDLQSFVEYAKANPGAVKVGTSGAGAAPHLAALAFAQKLGIEFSYFVYDGSADCVTAIASKEIDCTFTQPTPAVAQIEAGTEKMIGFLADERLGSYSDVPTVNEEYPEADLVMRGWVMVAAPAGIPEDIKDYLVSAFAKALETDEYKTNIENLGMQHTVIYGDDLQAMIDSDMEFYQGITAGIDLNAG